MIFLLCFLTVVCVSGITDIHACLLVQQTGSFNRENLMKANTLYKELLADRNNMIGIYPVNITWHYVDGESNKSRIYELGRQLYYGNWTSHFFDNGTLPHPCDVIFFARTSTLLPSLLGGLKDYNLRLPVYPYGTNGITAFMNSSVPPHVPLWDNVVVAETLCDKELVGVLEWLHMEGAKKIFLLWEPGAGAYIDSLVNSVRTDSAKYGWTIVFDKAFEWEACTDNVCGIKQRKKLKDLMDSYVIKFDLKYTADVFISLRNTVKNHECLDEMTYFHDNMINFKAYVMVGCVSSVSEDKQIAENNMHHYMIGSVGWKSTFKGQHYDEEFSSVGFFESAGVHSPVKFAELWSERFDEIPSHLSAAAPLTPFYYFHRDVINAYGIVSNIINNFDNSRTPESSFYGLMACDITGTNPFQKWMAVQIMNDDTLKVINQDTKGVYAAPFWQYRYCYPKCVKCPNCAVVERVTKWVYLVCVLPFVSLIVIMMLHRKTQEFQLIPKIVTVASMMSLNLKNASCALSIIIVMMKYHVGLVHDLAGAVTMLILTSFALCFSFVTMKTKLAITWYSYKLDVKNSVLSEEKQVAGSKALYTMGLIESTSEFIIPLLTDLPIAIIQLETVIVQEVYSPTMISSLVLLVFSIGGALKMNTISSLICHCLEYENIPIIGNFTSKMKLKCAFNPCYSATQLLRGVLAQAVGKEGESPLRSGTFSEVDRALTEISKNRVSISVISAKGEKQKSL